ncbi:MAG: hypothetical protein RLZZ175_1493 [Bacteroidota bacterium]|jgi:hypothetical protein
MKDSINNLERFIQTEKEYFKQLNTDIDWDNNVWDVSNLLFHRGKDNLFNFTSFSKLIKSVCPNDTNLKVDSISNKYINFIKAIVSNVYRNKKIGYVAIRNYMIECKRIYILLLTKNQSQVNELTRIHFDELVDLLKENKYKNLYDAATNLQSIAKIIDEFELTPYPICFKHNLTSNHRFHEVKTIKEIEENKRIGEEKLPSYEAIKAYAICTNNPINDNEEILLRTIDLLIAMGQRGNEVTVLPLDCWVEKELIDKNGKVITDAHNKPIVKTGIRYYAEKLFKSRVHWLAEQDIQFAKRAYDRLVILTKEVREVAKWQENNPDRLWDLSPDLLIDDDDLMNYFHFKSIINLQSFTKNLKIPVQFISKSYKREKYFDQGRFKNYRKNQLYLVRNIENALLAKKNDHIVLKELVNGQWKTILKTSETLSISFDGAFRFNLRTNLSKLFPQRTTIIDINNALGSKLYESIFERRNLTEADGSKIKMTSHQPRHWRNTLYELAGMSNVQQALALGRKNLNQNAAYQHTNVKEKTEFHRDFISFNSIVDKVNYLHNGVRNKNILGSITDTYHYLKEKEDLNKAEDFLKTHAMAIHITPFGGCTHDFSQTPCVKHLQCWNNCSHLHRTNIPGETERIQEQLDQSLKVLEKMKSDSDEYGSDKWIIDLEIKIANLEKAVKMNPIDKPVQVSPNGIQMTIPLDFKSKSSV